MILLVDVALALVDLAQVVLDLDDVRHMSDIIVRNCPNNILALPMFHILGN